MLARGASWFCLIALAVLSLLPAHEIDPLRNYYYWLGLRAEHVVAYAGTAMILHCGYASRFGLLRAGACLLAYGALLEVAQAFSPGRTPQVTDLLEDAVGILVGTLFFLLLRSARERAIRRDGARARRPEPREPHPLGQARPDAGVRTGPAGAPR